jgi:prepilin-type N-terminal cleavage/methylation domain-containing protein
MKRKLNTVRYWRGGRAAFSFLELLCVLMILSMIAVIAVPRYGNAIVQNRANAAARRITMDLALAQKQAKLRGTSQTVAFDATLDKYYMAKIEDPDHTALAYQVFLGDEPYNTAIVSADFNGDANLTFDAFGLPDNGGAIIIQIGNCRKRLTVADQTARVTIADVAPVGEVIPVPRGVGDEIPLQEE